jgi:hypothetical protein
LFAAVTADVIELCAPLAFEDALSKLDGLNDLATYAQLVKAGDVMGVPIDKVLFRGYSTPAAPQRLHGTAIETRINLRLAAERMVEEERQADENLAANKRRAQNQIDLECKREEQELECARQKADHQLEIENKKHKTEEEHARRMGDIEVQRLGKIRELDSSMNIGAYLCVEDAPTHTVVQCSSTFHDGSSTATVTRKGNTGQLPVAAVRTFGPASQ